MYCVVSYYDEVAVGCFGPFIDIEEAKELQAEFRADASLEEEYRLFKLTEA